MVKKGKILRITQIKSGIGFKPKAKATLQALGLKKMNQSTNKNLDSAIKGMINTVKHLVKVEEIK